MRTTLNLPEDLVEEAKSLLRFESKTDTVIHALQELVRRKKLEQLKALAGKVDLRIDVSASRRRPDAARKPRHKR